MNLKYMGDLEEFVRLEVRWRLDWGIGRHCVGKKFKQNGEEITNNSGEEKVLSMGIRQVRTVSWSLNWGQAVFFSNVFVYQFLQSP